MNNGRIHRKSLVTTIFLVVAAGAVVGGCSRETRYEILTFFFTGVPPLDAPETAADGKKETDSKNAALTATEKHAAKLLQRRKDRLATLPWIHGPYGANDCGRCHAFGASRVFRKSAVQSTAPTLGGATQERLIVPKQELCFGCHGTKTAEIADARGLRIHGPVAAGECTACHSPHGAPRRYMLRMKNNVELCAQCHDLPGIAQRTPVHRDITKTECTNCHDPHMGRPMMILRQVPVQAANPAQASLR